MSANFSRIMLSIIILATIGSLLCGCHNAKTTNDKAEKDTKGRYLTIINETDQVINEVHITVGEGTEIEDMELENPDETSFSIKIPKQYSEYDDFMVVLIDRYEMAYTKNVTDVPLTGRTEVVISQDDYLESKGDFWKKVNKFFNGD